MDKNNFSLLLTAVKQHLDDAPGCHDFTHTQRVMHNAELLLVPNPAADADTVRLAALLHDIARPEELQAKGKICHAERGAVMAKQLLLKYNFTDSALIERVTNAI
jgi:uncharacterized protein